MQIKSVWEKKFIQDKKFVVVMNEVREGKTCLMFMTAVLKIRIYVSLLLQSSDEGPVYVAEVLANLTKESAKSRNSAAIKPNPAGSLGEMQVLRSHSGLSLSL